MSPINLNELTIFLEVARQRSFTQTAQRLNITQSAVSQAMRHLEQSLKTKLFHRTTRSVTLTERGEQLRQQIQTPLTELQDSLIQFQHQTGEVNGTVRINADETVIHHFLYS